MELYFSPLASSLATRISLYEAGATAGYVEVDMRAKKTRDGGDFLAVHSLGLVPALRLDDGTVLSENCAVLSYVADRYPEAGLAPRDPGGRARLNQWLSFVATELEQVVYTPLLDPKAGAEVKAYALAKARVRLECLARGLEGRQYLLDRYSIADAYLFTILNWSQAAPVDLAPYAPITSFMKTMMDRPAVARAFEQEKQLYVQQIERRRAAQGAA